jgi:glutamate-1-semialdehyde 2,1-aminomutase
MKIDLLIQVRMNSSRLPGKVLLKILDKTIIQHMHNRLSKCNNINEIIFLTSTNSEDDEIYKHCIENNFKCYRGSETNLLERHYQCANLINSDIIIRYTGDNPLADPVKLDEMIEYFLNLNQSILYCNYNNNCFPDGSDPIIFTMNELKDAYINAISDYDKEHVHPYIARKYKELKTFDYNIKQENYKNVNLSKLHLSLDTINDFNIIKNIYENIYSSNNIFTINNVLDYLEIELSDKNSIIFRLFEEQNKFNKKFNFELNSGAALYKEAKKIIPGGTQLLSKRPEMFLPEHWPSYYRKAKGIEVITLDGIVLKDFGYMGLGTAILGYANDDINRVVKKSVNKGNICTLNCPSEVELAKLLVELHPWADMARFTRTAGEACAMAVRIARASSKKDKIAFCGYHGWHDWYLATNWNDTSSLDKQLLKGLSPVGVPKALKNTAFPFNYNNIDELKEIIKNHDIGTIIMEPQRSEYPKDGFLEKVRNICNENNIILIFDEVTSGFRLNTGGLHLKLGVNPDMAVFGKGLANGYPSAAVIGKRNIIEAAQETFISSSFFTEDIGYVAAIEMIKQHKKLNVGEYIETLGNYFMNKLEQISKNIGINIILSGLPCFGTFSFDYENDLMIRTLYVQKMLERNILAKTSLYLSYAHKKDDIDFYLKNIEEVFKELKLLIDNNNIESQLKGPLAHTGFQRLA